VTLNDVIGIILLYFTELDSLQAYYVTKMAVRPFDPYCRSNFYISVIGIFLPFSPEGHRVKTRWLDSMTFIHELYVYQGVPEDQNELATSRLSKVIVLQTERQTYAFGMPRFCDLDLWPYDLENLVTKISQQASQLSNSAVENFNETDPQSKKCKTANVPMVPTLWNTVCRVLTHLLTYISFIL